MTVQSAVSPKVWRKAGVALAVLCLVILWFTAPKVAAAAEVNAPGEPITSAQELVDFLNSGAAAGTPNAELNNKGDAQLLAPVTITGDANVEIATAAGDTIGLNLGGQTLTLANAPANRDGQLYLTGDGTFELTGEGSLICSIPAGQELVGLFIRGANADIAAAVTIERSESATTQYPYVYIDAGSINLHEGATLRQAATNSGETYDGTYPFVQIGYYDNTTPCSFTMDGGAVDIIDNHWGIEAIDGGTIALGAGAINHVCTEMVALEYPDALAAIGASSLIMAGGTVGPQTAVGAQGGGQATVMGGTINGVLYGDGDETTVTFAGGTITGYNYADEGGGLVSLDISRGATGTMTGGVLNGNASAEYDNAVLTISGGTVQGELTPLEEADIIVTGEPEKAPAVFSHPVAPGMLQGLEASLLVNDVNDGATISYYQTLAAAQTAAEAAFTGPTIVNCLCSTVTADAVVDFSGFGYAGDVSNQVLETYCNFVGADLVTEKVGTALYAYASVTPGQAYTFTFTDEDGATVGEKTLTAGPNDTGLFATLDVSAPTITVTGDADGPSNTAGDGESDDVPAVDAGVYTVSVKLASGATAAEQSFGLSLVTFDFNGGRFEDALSITILCHQGRWGTFMPTRPGYAVRQVTSVPEGLVSLNDEFDQWVYALPLGQAIDATLTTQWTEDVVSVFRLWNPYDGAHLLTTDRNEVEVLTTSHGWKDESVVFSVYGSDFPGSTPVTRLYNPNNGDHLYSTRASEVADLVAVGWQDEGVKFYGSPDTTYPVYRLWNSLQTANGGLGSHLWTADKNEYETLPLLPPVDAWRQEGTVWYAVDLPASLS